MASGEFTHEPAPPLSALSAHAVWQLSSLARTQPRRTGADSTVKMVTNGAPWSCGTLLYKVHPRLAGGFISVELVADPSPRPPPPSSRCIARFAPGVCQPGPTSP